MIRATHVSEQECVLVALDKEKGFDTLDWADMMDVLEGMGFGTHFLD